MDREDGDSYVNCEPTTYGYAIINRALMEAAESDDGDAVDDDPYCVCGVALSEHGLLGCQEGFQTPEQWNRERDAIREHIWSGGDYDDDGHPIFDNYHDYD